MPLTQKEVIEGGMGGSYVPRKLYLLLDRTLETHIPQILVVLNERELEDYRRLYTSVIEIGTAHPDLALGISWEVRGIRRLDIAGLPGNPIRKKGDNEMDSGV